MAKRKRLWSAHGAYVGPRPARGFEVHIAGLAADVEGAERGFSFAAQAEQFPALGEPGISYTEGEPMPGKVVQVLLHRDAEGRLDGILYHYTFDAPPWERKGSCNVLVDPAKQRQGIGSALLRAAGPRFNLDLSRQCFTPGGAALANRLIARRR